MHYLSHYTKQAQDDLYNKCGVFWAFNDAQFKEGVAKIKASTAWIDGDKLKRIPHGGFCISRHVDTFIDGLEETGNAGRKADIADNGIDGIIQRELGNYECQITGNITDAVSALAPYGITEEQVSAGYKIFFAECVRLDLF